MVITAAKTKGWVFFGNHKSLHKETERICQNHESYLIITKYCEKSANSEIYSKRIIGKNNSE